MRLPWFCKSCGNFGFRSPDGRCKDCIKQYLQETDNLFRISPDRNLDDVPRVGGTQDNDEISGPTGFMGTCDHNGPTGLAGISNHHHSLKYENSHHAKLVPTHNIHTKSHHLSDVYSTRSSHNFESRHDDDDDSEIIVSHHNSSNEDSSSDSSDSSSDSSCSGGDSGGGGADSDY